MRRRISLLVAATTSAVVLAFVIPLGLLVRTLADNRAVASASQEATSVAVVVAGVPDLAQLTDLVQLVASRSRGSVIVALPNGQLVGNSRVNDETSLARARAGEAFTRIDLQGAQVFVPVVTARGTAVVRTSVSRQEMRRGVTAAWLTLAGLGLLLLLLALIAADRLGRRISAPLDDLAGVAHRLRAGDLSSRALAKGPWEVVELGTALNRLAERIGELLVAEREAVADLSHRLRTPVTALRLDVEAVQPPEMAQRLRDHVDHLARTVDAVVKDARRPVGASVGRVCDAAGVVRERAAFWSALAEDQGRNLEVVVPSRPMMARIDASDLVDVVDALVDNVFAHTPEGTSLLVALGRDSAGRVRLEVADDGHGLADLDLAERGRSGSGSSGLGLDIVRRAAIAAGGELHLTTSGVGGTVALVTFAAAPP